MNKIHSIAVCTTAILHTCSKIALNLSAATLFLCAAKFIAVIGNEWLFWFA